MFPSASGTPLNSDKRVVLLVFGPRRLRKLGYGPRPRAARVQRLVTGTPGTGARRTISSVSAAATAAGAFRPRSRAWSAWAAGRSRRR